MNILSPEEIQILRDAFDRGLGVRKAARETGFNRETCSRYFHEWQICPARTEFSATYVVPDDPYNIRRKITLYAVTSNEAWDRAKAMEDSAREHLKMVGSGCWR